MRRTPLALLLLVLTACGGGEARRDRPAPRAVTGAVDLEKPRAGAPDGGTVAGHGADGGIGTTSAAAFVFTGRVDPPDSRVAVSEGAVRVERSGRFTVAVASPPRGTPRKAVRVEATKPGHRPWRVDVRVVRSVPGRVRVPERDVTAPAAALLLRPGGGGAPVVLASPSRAGDRPDVVALPRPAFTATAVGRDPEGGVGRIRLSVLTTTRCGGEVRRRVRYRPPPQIANVAIPPGASAPVERQRTARIRLDAGTGCTVRGEVWAEATDAHGRQAVTHHAGFSFP